MFMHIDEAVLELHDAKSYWIGRRGQFHVGKVSGEREDTLDLTANYTGLATNNTERASFLLFRVDYKMLKVSKIAVPKLLFRGWSDVSQKYSSDVVGWDKRSGRVWRKLPNVGYNKWVVSATVDVEVLFKVKLERIWL